MTSSPTGDPQYPAPGPPAQPYAASSPYAAPSPYAEPSPYAAPSARPAPYPRASYPSAGYAPYPLLPPPRPPQSDRRWVTVLAAVLVAAGLVAAGIGATHSNSSAVAGSGSAVLVAPSQPGTGGSGSSTPSTPSGPSGSTPPATTPPASTTPGAATPTARQAIGIVTIVSVLRYQGAESAGTGMIISPTGEILTNNHVINGATSVTVTDQTTGRAYRADVVGTAPTKDVAVLRLRDASGLQTAALATTSATVHVGDPVVGVGNAGGTGRLSAAKGAVTALGQTITASDEGGAEKERLNNLIQTNAPIISGDSGGPLYDADGKIIGIDTAASASRSTTKVAYAIPIDDARTVVRQIESGVQTATIHIGLPGFLGITSKAGTNGVLVQDVVTNGPAGTAGITPDSTITAVDGKAVTTPTGLRNILTVKDPGDKVSVTWIGANGTRHTQTVTLTTGPAD